jgi:hypothetical protein
MSLNRAEIDATLTQLESYFSQKPEHMTQQDVLRARYWDFALYECGMLRREFEAAGQEVLTGGETEIGEARKIIMDIEGALLAHDLEAGRAKCRQIRVICDRIWPPPSERGIAQPRT